MTGFPCLSPARIMVGKYYKVPFLDANDPNMRLPAATRKSGSKESIS